MGVLVIFEFINNNRNITIRYSGRRILRAAAELKRWASNYLDMGFSIGYTLDIQRRCEYGYKDPEMGK
jgi:hypothetical protein